MLPLKSIKKGKSEKDYIKYLGVLVDQFTSEEYNMFLKYNAIQHTKTPPGHPATNGLAERYVGHFKDAMKKMSDKVETIQEKLDIFTHLQSYTHTHRKITSRIINERTVKNKIQCKIHRHKTTG